MYKITLPIDLNGERYGIRFFRGAGETDNERIAALMKAKGFEVEQTKEKRNKKPSEENES